jgi:hypothetical protein
MIVVYSTIRYNFFVLVMEDAVVKKTQSLSLNQERERERALTNHNSRVAECDDADREEPGGTNAQMKSHWSSPDEREREKKRRSM